MKVLNIRIRNFGSLRDLPLDRLDNFVVLLGKNGAGKSFLFEALHCFFNEFDAIGGETRVGTDDNLWYGRTTNEPIQLDLTLQFDAGEIARVFTFSEELLNEIKKSCSQEVFRRVKISRSLTFGGSWKTNSIRWANIELIKDDHLIAIQRLARLQKKFAKLDAYQFAFFTSGQSADNIGGDRLLLDLANKVAYHSDPRIDSLVSQDIIKAVNVYSIPEFRDVTDWREWATKEGYAIVERPPTAEEAPQIHETPGAVGEPNFLQQVISNLTGLIKESFIMIPAARDAQATPGVRHPFVEQAHMDSWRKLSLSRKRGDEAKWHKFRSGAESFILKDLEPNPEEILIRDDELRLPIAYVGGGEQVILEFQWWFLEGKPILAIEEPENHLHPELCRQVFRFLKQQSKNRQVFLSTHSPMFVDKQGITNNWVLRYERDKGESKAYKVESREDMKLALAELGVLPSDIYLKDLIIFVEGGTENEAVLPILGSKLGINMEDNIGVMNIGGDRNLERYLKVWLKFMHYAPADYLVILDAHSADLAVRLANELKIEISRFHVWKNGSIEDYYPLDIVLEALKELFGVEVDSKDINKKQPLDKELKRILESQGKICGGWKVMIGSYVSERIKPNKIPKEIREVLNAIKSRIEI